jgi:chromosome segregation ATPase
MKAWFALPLLLVPVLAGVASAQSSDDALRERLRQVTLQLRQAQDDQATLQAQKAAAEHERDEAKKQLAAAQAELGRTRHEGTRTAAVQQDLAKTQDALAQATTSAKQSEAERAKLQTNVTNTTTLLTACESKDAELLKVGHDILDAYSKFDFDEWMGANEPFTELHRVELENQAQTFEDRIDNGRYDPRSIRPPATTPAPAPAPDKPEGATQ